MQRILAQKTDIKKEELSDSSFFMSAIELGALCISLYDPSCAAPAVPAGLRQANRSTILRS